MDKEVVSSEPIRITGVIVEEVGTPRNDRTPGSALYEVPFRLSRQPSELWARLFVETWDMPPGSITSMHRPGIARVEDDRIILDGTTIEEVEKYHLDTLKRVVQRVNQLVAEYEQRTRQKARETESVREQHKQHVREVSSKLKFD